MTDRELLELAAKAAGYDVRFTDEYGFTTDVDGYWPHGFDKHGDVIDWWNPLTDDGDALRLAVKLKLSPEYDNDEIYVSAGPDFTAVETNTCIYAATRRAVVRAAAEIGRTK